MSAILCGANGAMGKLIDNILGSEVVGRVSIDGENGAARTFEELGEIAADVLIDFPTIPPSMMCSITPKRPAAPLW